MGIKDLFKVLRTHCPEAIVATNLSTLAGKRIAIDISVFLYKYIKTAGDDWLDSLILLLCRIKKMKIRAVCVFDGDEAPAEKKQEQLRRREEFKKIAKRADTCQEVYEKVYTSTIGTGKLDDHTAKQVTTLLTVRGKCDADMTDILDVCNKLEKRMYNMRKQATPVTQQHREQAMEVVRLLGLAYFQADGEAEALCVHLNRAGKVDGVLTEDTDVLAHGAHNMYCKINLNTSDCVHINHEVMLTSLAMSRSQFRDMCILLGCDYNHRPRGYGPVRAHAVIVKHKSIEKIIENENIDTSQLHYQRCRELFTPPILLSRYELPINIAPNMEGLKEFFIEHNVTINPKVIADLWKTKVVVIHHGQEGQRH